MNIKNLKDQIAVYIDSNLEYLQSDFIFKVVSEFKAEISSLYDRKSPAYEEVSLFIVKKKQEKLR